MSVVYLLGIIGIVLIFSGAEIVVRNAQRLALIFGISEAFIGLTLLSIGTSLPEIFTHIVGSMHILADSSLMSKVSGLVVGTNIGSNFIQITLITGIVGLCGVIVTTKKFMRTDYLIMLGAILLLWLLGVDGMISRLEGAGLATAYLGYMYYLIKRENLNKKIHARHKTSGSWLWCLGGILLGLVMLYYGADWVLSGAELIVTSFHLESSMFGVLALGVITALPELTTSVVAVIRKSPTMGLGTLVGSNITNPMLALGIGATISNYTMSPEVLYFDLPAWFLVSVIIGFFMLSGYKLNKKEAGFMCVTYVVFLYLRMRL